VRNAGHKVDLDNNTDTHPDQTSTIADEKQHEELMENSSNAEKPPANQQKPEAKAEVLYLSKIEDFPQEILISPNVSGGNFENTIPKKYLKELYDNAHKNRDGKKVVIYATMLPSPEKDKNTLEKDIYKVLPAVFRTMQSPILAVVCSPKSEKGRNIIHLIVVVSDVLKIPDSLSEKWSKQCELLDSVSPSKKKRSSVVVNKFQSARAFLRKRLSSAWAIFQKALCIVSVLYLFVTLLVYFLFFWDNSLEITLPKRLSDNKSVSVWAYDNEGQPCEPGNKLSQDDPRHIIKCENPHSPTVNTERRTPLFCQTDGIPRAAVEIFPPPE